MKREQWSGYSKYLVCADASKFLTGSYTGYTNLMELIKELSQMVGKQHNTYTYNGETYVSNLTSTEINTIISCLETGTFNSGLDKIRHLSGVQRGTI